MSWRPQLSVSLKELRIHLCSSSQGSAGLRSFVKSSYALLKKDNPSLPILIREAPGIEARIFGRYALGVEKKLVVDGLSEKDIESKLKTLATAKN